MNVKLSVPSLFGTLIITMILVALIFGPNPQPTVLVLDENVTHMNIPGYKVYTISDLDIVGGFYLLHAAYSQEFDVVILGKFNLPKNELRKQNLIDSLEVIKADKKFIIVDDNRKGEVGKAIMTMSKNEKNVILSKDPVKTAENLKNKINKHRILNFPSLFIIAAIIEAILSFILVGVLAFWITKYSLENNLKNSLIFIVGIICITEAVFLYTSRLFGMPIISHARDRLTAASLIPGLGGGNLVRMFVALIASCFAIYRSKIKINWRISLATIVILFLLISFTFGIVNFLIFVMTGEGSGTYLRIPYVLQLILKLSYVIKDISLAETCGVTVSRGLVICIASAIIFTVMNEIKKEIRSVFMIILMFLFARGLTRIGDMNPLSLIMSIIPGIIIGLGVVELIQLTKRKNLKLFFRKKVR